MLAESTKELLQCTIEWFFVEEGDRMRVGHTAKNSIVLSCLRNLACWQGMCRWTQWGLRENGAEEDVTLL